MDFKIFVFYFLILWVSQTGFCKTEAPSSGQKVYTKVAVGLGSTGSSSMLDDIEVIDLASMNSQCQNLPHFPFAGELQVGGLGQEDNPTICGGVYNRIASSSCYSLQNGSWKLEASWKDNRVLTAMIRSPFPNDGSKLFVTGGEAEMFVILNSTVVLTETGWYQATPMPMKISSHCMVLINSTAAMVIGGREGEDILPVISRVFILNGETKVWSEGPDLELPREIHSCAMIKSDIQSKEKSVIVVGGSNMKDYYLSSTQILDPGSSVWRSGPELPFEIQSASLVEDHSGGVVLIGGFGKGHGALGTLFRLPHAGSGAAWEEMQQKLKTKRFDHTAFLIPDEIADCK